MALTSSCAISEATYDRLAAETAERDTARYRAALEDFNARGFVLLSDRGGQLALLEPLARERCVAAIHHVESPVQAEQPISDMGVVVTTMGSPDADGGRIRTTASPDEACAFFDERAAELRVTREDGTTGVLLRGTPGLLARNRAGEIVEVQIEVEIVDHTTVLVDRTCNDMPRSTPRPIEIDSPVFVTWGPRKVLKKVTMPLQRESLEIECTETVH